MNTNRHPPHRLLVIEDDVPTSRAGVCAALERGRRFTCERVRWGEISSERVSCPDTQLIVMVVDSPRQELTNLLEAWRGRPPAVPTMAVLPSGLDDGWLRPALEAIDDFLFAPVREVELGHRVSRLLGAAGPELETVRARLLEELGTSSLVGADPAFLRAIGHLPRFARSEASVLITGETGTGKELCARSVHHLGRRRRFPFVAVDCGALPDHLLENELFGHARGAYTDAHRDHKGMVAMAEGGTLFLDEIDALSMTAQNKLLRFLQEHTFRPLGSDRFQRADVKVITASNRDLESAVRDGLFRANLYFRLSVLRIHLPPLRHRRGDVELLACAALQEHAGSIDTSPKTFSTAALRLLAQHDWPGNVRELYNVVQRALVACDGGHILPTHILLESAAAQGAGGEWDCPPRGCFRTEKAAAVAAFERRYVEELLRKHRGNVTHAAREAQQDRRAFGRVIKKHQIDRRAI